MSTPQYEECPICGQRIRLRRDGRLRDHYVRGSTGFFQRRASEKCRGSGVGGIVRRIMES